MSQGLLVPSVDSDSKYKDLMSGVFHAGVSTDCSSGLAKKRDVFCFKVLQKGLAFGKLSGYSC